MARRKKAGLAEDLLDLVSMLPWWTGVVLAVVSYLVLHRFAATVPVAPAQPAQIGDFIVRSLGATLAGFGQYILPLICLMGAGVSAWRRRHRQGLVTDVAQAQSASVLDGMSWREFESLVGEAFRLQGFRVEETGGGSPDGGVDLVLGKGSERFFVQCKQWKAYKVGVDVVRELYGVMAARGAAGGFVVTSGTFTADAKAFADGRGVNLVDGQRLFDLIKRARTSLASQPCAAPAGPAVALAASGPSCPVCGSGMVKRTARQGANAGSQFWGCATYPKCRGTRAVG
jgi:restriction system protein